MALGGCPGCHRDRVGALGDRGDHGPGVSLVSYCQSHLHRHLQVLGQRKVEVLVQHPCCSWCMEFKRAGRGRSQEVDDRGCHRRLIAVKQDQSWTATLPIVPVGDSRPFTLWLSLLVGCRLRASTTFGQVGRFRDAAGDTPPTESQPASQARRGTTPEHSRARRGITPVTCC
jgi:hypothetical protein